ncbi:MAG: hypothetical protein M3Q16_10555 [Pseudomonadota bacterium]|nr:hypothetical protein [Pseudomonadota bacterium]
MISDFIEALEHAHAAQAHAMITTKCVLIRRRMIEATIALFKFAELALSKMKGAIYYNVLLDVEPLQHRAHVCDIHIARNCSGTACTVQRRTKVPLLFGLGITAELL